MLKLVNDIEVLWIARFDYKPDWILSKHNHEGFWQLIYIIDGECELQIRDDAFSISGTKILLFPPGIEHGFSRIGVKGMRTIDTKFMLHSKTMIKELDKLSYVIEINSKEYFYHMEEIHKHAIKHISYYQDHASILLTLILVKLLEQNHKEQLQNKKLLEGNEGETVSRISHKIIEYISENYSNSISGSDLEEISNYSYRYISKIFSNDLDLTPMKYLEIYRIERAKELLSYSEFELKNICEMVGFVEIHHFARVFKKITGESPGNWRTKTKSAIRKDILIDPNFHNTLLIRSNNNSSIVPK